MPFLTPDAPPANRFRYRALRIPDSPEFLSLVMGALASLIYQSEFEQFGSLTPVETAELFKAMHNGAYDLIVPYIGMVIHSAYYPPPAEWLPMDGSTYDADDWPELWEVLHPAFKISGTQFTLPNLAGRAMVGEGTISGGSTEYEAGTSGGAESVTLTTAELPSHSHTDAGHSHFRPNSPGLTVLVVAPGEAPALAPNAVPGVTSTESANIQATGEDEPHENRTPFTTIPAYMVAR